MQQKFLRDVIETYVPLGRESAKGFRAVRCASCNDHSERGGFRFNGNEISYNCFNCGAKFFFEEGSGKISRNARSILEAFGISRELVNEVLGSSFFNQPKVEDKKITMEKLKPKVSLFTPEIELPPHCHPLGSPLKEELQVPLIEYLLNRKLDPLLLKAHFSLDIKHLGRVIIPCYRDGKVIFWQSRTIFKDEKPRYLSPGTTKDAVLWGYDNIWKNWDLPLFITEGIFDASHLEGVALLGSELTQAKLEIINKSKRRRVIVVDRNENGKKLAEIALKQGWQITFPPEGTTDTNDSVCKRGLLYTIYHLVKHITSPDGVKAADGVTVQSKLELQMQLALAKLGRK